MWFANIYVILSICVTVASIASIPLVTKRFAQFKLQQSIEIRCGSFKTLPMHTRKTARPRSWLQ